MEAFIGLKLLERTTRRVSPTAEGENFIPVAERLIRDFDTAIHDIRATAERRSGHVSLAIVPSVATNLLPSIIKTFSARYPGISVRLDDDTSRGVQLRVERNEVDFGLGSIWQGNKILEFTPLFSDKLELICHKDHPLARKSAPIRWQQLQNHTFLDTGITRTLSMRQAFGPSKFDFPNMTTLLAMLRSNLGVTVLPSLAIPKPSKELVARPLVDPVETREVCLIKRKDWTLSPAAEAMIETIVAETPKRVRELGLTLIEPAGPDSG